MAATIKDTSMAASAQGQVTETVPGFSASHTKPAATAKTMMKKMRMRIMVGLSG